MAEIFDTWNPAYYRIERPYVPSRLSYSHPNPARYMLIGHSKNWPAHVERARYHNADHDRLLSWDYQKTRDAFNKHMGTGELGVPEFVNRRPQHVAALLSELMGVEVEAWRVLGTVNRSNGYPVFSFEVVTPARAMGGT